MLDVIQLGFDYSDKPLLQGVHFSLEAGCLLHLDGPNGAGKTTLLKLLAGLLCPDQGEIRYRGMPIAEKKCFYREGVCYLGHKTGVSALLTPREHWRFDLPQVKKVISFDEAMEQLFLQGLEDTPCGLLSAGQRRRVGLLRLLVSNASLWLLDEPLIALDRQAMDGLKQILHQHTTSGGQVILTSHQPLPLESGNYQVYAL